MSERRWFVVGMGSLALCSYDELPINLVYACYIYIVCVDATLTITYSSFVPKRIHIELIKFVLN